LFAGSVQGNSAQVTNCLFPAGKSGRKTPAHELLQIGAIRQSRILVDAVLAETGKLLSAWIGIELG